MGVVVAVFTALFSRNNARIILQASTAAEGVTAGLGVGPCSKALGHAGFGNLGGVSALTGHVSVPLLQVFQGNFDNDTHRKNVIEPPIYARLIRILPWSWYGRITLRIEILGCTEEE